MNKKPILLEFISYEADLQIQGLLLLGFAIFLIWLYFKAGEDNSI